ncbi:MAG: hypothetical protein K8I02_04100, partial [Candidatus Methylomirabilis sp.]|nr:hypothetical protein [Deltaproteobacteria bacterium]
EVGFATVSGAGPDAMRRIAESVLRGATAIAVRGRAEMDFSALAEDFMAAIGENPVVHMPLDFVMLGRVLGLLTGLGRALRQKKVRVDKIVFPYLMERFAPPA